MPKIEVTLDDAQRMFNQTLCAYKGEMVYCADIRNDFQVLLMDVFSQKLRYVQFDMEHFQALSKGRLGYLNFGDVCCYASRAPVRKYAVGIDVSNFKINWGDYGYTKGDQHTIEKLATSFSSTSFYDTYNGIFPTFEEAVAQLKKTGKYIAFDRQFALSKKGNVFYRGESCGKYDLKTANSVDDIVWEAGMEYLAKLAKPGFKVSEK